MSEDRAIDEEEGQAQAPGEESGPMVKQRKGTDQEAVSTTELEQDPPKRPEIERTTAPQSPYTNRDVAVGAGILLVGLLVAFVIPLLLA